MGKPYYKLDIEYWNLFLNTAINKNRKVVEQVLNLNQDEKQTLFDFLQWNARPENCNYYYNYIYNNCATKIRDVIDSVFDHKIIYDYSYVKEDLTFRDLMNLYLKEQHWGDLGINLCLGTGIDKVASGYHYMFLPDYVEQAFANAIFHSDNTNRQLIKETITRYVHSPEYSAASQVTPLLVFIILFLFYGFITYNDFKRKKITKLADVILFSVVGFVGWILLFLWFCTNHISENNFNLAWAMPLHIPIAFFILKKDKSRFIRIYFLLNAIVVGLLLVFWNFWPQDLNESLIPIIIILLVRYVVIIRMKN